MKYNRLLRLKEKNGEMGKFVLCLVLMMSWMSCQKDLELFIPNTNVVQAGDIHRLTTKLKQDIAGDITYTVSCPCFGDKAFEIDKDLVLQVPPNFVNLAQYPCANGSFDIDVTVCDSKGEIMIAGIPTITADDLIASRVEINTQIRKGNQHISLAHGKQFRILVNDPDPLDRMELFYGDGNRWIEADNNPDTWSSVANSEWWIQQDSSEIISGFGYECFSDSTDWINIDMFFAIPEEQRTPVCVDLPDDYTNTNTLVFLVFRDYNSVVGMVGDPELKKFCEPYGQVPLGFRATVLAISERGENIYYFAKQEITVTENLEVSLQPLKTPYDEIFNYLKQL
jgi:hypothetical protein